MLSGVGGCRIWSVGSYMVDVYINGEQWAVAPLKFTSESRKYSDP